MGFTEVPLVEDYFGPPSDFGSVVCHGCEALTDMGEWHYEGCPLKCVREDCGWHFWINQNK